MESKDGKDSVIFSLGNPAGPSVEQPRAWSSGTTSPQEWPPLPTWTGSRRKKTPSQYRRDKRRRDQFFAKKKESEAVKGETTEDNHKTGHLIENPSDEIELEEIPENENTNEIKSGDLFKIEGEYKNANFKPWSKIEPQNVMKVLWDDIKTVNSEISIEEIGEGSSCFEHFFQFWGTWQVKKENITLDYLKNSENWPRGVKITKVEPA